MEKYEKEFMSEIENSKITDSPIKFNPADYESASKEYLNLIKPKKNNIKSIYQVGSIGVPGISDIDYLIIFDNESKDNYGKYHILNLSKKSNYIFSHNSWLINEKVFRKLNLWFPFFDLNRVYGDDILINKKKSKNIDVILILQYLINKIPSDFVLFSTLNKKLRQRTLLTLINSLRHTINLVYSLGIPSSRKWDIFVDNFDLLRKNWFTEKRRNEKLKNFIFESIEISFEVILAMDKYLIEKLGLRTKEASFKLYLRNKTLIFERDWNSADKKINYFPISFGVFIYLWINSKTKIGKQISKKVSKRISYSCPEKLRKEFNKYASILEEYNNFSRNKFNMNANGYHILWTPFYENPLRNWLHDKLFRLFAIPYISLNKIKTFLN